MFDMPPGMPPNGIIIPSASDRLVSVSTNEARNLSSHGQAFGSPFQLSGKCAVLGSCQGGCPHHGPEGFIEILLVFPEDAWSGSDFSHVEDFHPDMAPPEVMMRVFELRPIAVPKHDCKPLPANTLFYPKAMVEFIPKEEDNDE